MLVTRFQGCREMPPQPWQMPATHTHLPVAATEVSFGIRRVPLKKQKSTSEHKLRSACIAFILASQVWHILPDSDKVGLIALLKGEPALVRQAGSPTLDAAGSTVEHGVIQLGNGKRLRFDLTAVPGLYELPSPATEGQMASLRGRPEVREALLKLVPELDAHAGLPAKSLVKVMIIPVSNDGEMGDVIHDGFGTFVPLNHSEVRFFTLTQTVKLDNGSSVRLALSASQPI